MWIRVNWETATFNSNVTWDWWRQESVAICSDKLDQRLLRWRDRMRSGDGRRCSVFISVCLSQDSRNNHMLCLPQYVYLRVDPVTHSWVLLFIVCFERDVVYAWMFEPSLEHSIDVCHLFEVHMWKWIDLRESPDWLSQKKEGKPGTCRRTVSILAHVFMSCDGVYRLLYSFKGTFVCTAHKSEH